MAGGHILSDILCCPFHREGWLISRPDEFECAECGRVFKILDIQGITIPDFLISEAQGSWIKGPRPLDSKVILKFEGKYFERRGAAAGELVADVGCGENPHGDVNLDCYIPANIPQNFILANAELLPLRAKSVDVVSSYYNLEHLTNPALFIAKAAAIARKRVEIVTDNSEWIGDIFFRLIGSGRIFHDEHYYKWSVEYLRNLINRLGFNNCSVEAVNYSRSIWVRMVAKLSKIPRVGNMFLRDIAANIEL